MKKKITEKGLRNIIKTCLYEALRYDKERKQYFPKYTGDPHSDAGKFVDNDRDSFNYSKNDYIWSDPKKQDSFKKFQWENNFEVDPLDSDKGNQDNAEQYLQNHEADTVIEKVANEMSGEFNDMVGNFFRQAIQRYPILRNRYNMIDFYDRMRDVFDNYDY